MPRKKPEGPVASFQLKLYGEEAQRYKEINDRARKRNQRINDTEINRRLLGLDPDIQGEVTEEDRRIFLGLKPGKSRAAMAGQSKGTTHISAVPPAKRKRQ